MAEVDDWALPGTGAPSSGAADDWALPGAAAAPQEHGIFHHEPPAPGQGFWSFAAQGVPETLKNAGKFAGAVGSGIYGGMKDLYNTASDLGSGKIDPSTPEGSLQAANVAASVLPMSPAMRTGSAIARAATPPAGPAIASRVGENAVASALDLGPQVATPRPELDINLLPPETPHSMPSNFAGSRSVGSAGSYSDPLAGYSPETIASMRSLMENEGLTPYTLDQRLEEMSQHDFLGELSPNTSLSMSGLASKSPARNEIVNSVKQRALEAKDRMASAFDEAFGKGENTAQLAQTTKLDRDKQVDPFYRQFRSTEIPPTQQLAALLPRLEASGALRAANRSLAIEGLPSSIGFGETNLAGNLANEQRLPTAAAFQYAKEHLDKLIEQSLAAPGGAGDARRYTMLKNALVDAIDNHPDPTVAGIWRQARDAYAGPTQTLMATEFGKRLLTGNVSAEELPFMTSSYSPSEMRALRIGVRSYLEDIAGRPGKTDLRVINQVIAPNNQSKLRWILGDEQADRLIGAIEHEQRMHHAPSSLIYNSMTQPRTEAAKFWDAPAGAPAPLGSDLTLTDIGHTVNHAPGKLLSGAANVVLARQAAAHAAKVARVQEESARMMTLQGAERDAVLRSLVNPPAQQNVYSMGRGFARGGKVERSARVKSILSRHGVPA